MNLANVVSFLAESMALSGDLEEKDRLLSRAVEEYERTSVDDPNLSYANAVTLMVMVRKQLRKEQEREDLEVALAEHAIVTSSQPFEGSFMAFQVCGLPPSRGLMATMWPKRHSPRSTNLAADQGLSLQPLYLYPSGG